jgi:hypothetical protein
VVQPCGLGREDRDQAMIRACDHELAQLASSSPTEPKAHAPGSFPGNAIVHEALGDTTFSFPLQKRQATFTPTYFAAKRSCCWQWAQVA